MKFILTLADLELPGRFGRRELKLAITTDCLFKLGRCSYLGSTPFPSVTVFEVNIAGGRTRWLQVASKLNKLSTHKQTTSYFFTYRLQKGKRHKQLTKIQTD